MRDTTKAPLGGPDMEREMKTETVHIIRYPTGRFGFVGAVPIALMNTVDATRSDVMGGRAFWEDAVLKTQKGRSYANVADALGDARSVGALLCKSDGCACRSLF